MNEKALKLRKGRLMATAKRGANGAGTIKKRSDGRWEGRFTAGYDTKTGKQIQKSVFRERAKIVAARTEFCLLFSSIFPSFITILIFIVFTIFNLSTSKDMAF